MVPASSLFDLTGQVALVTGAGSESGIGFASAALLGSCGATVVLAATSDRVHDRAAQLRERGVAASAGVADLTDSDAAAALVTSVLDRHGRLDIVVNNAGMTSVTDPAESGLAVDTSDQAWRHGISRNLDTAFFVTRAALPAMTSAGYGRVVNVASTTGVVGAMVGEPAYAAAKAGMVGLTRALALEVARDGVTVNAVCPGWIATGSQTPHEHEQGLATPVGRSAHPDEVAAAVVWLATPAASYVTGQSLVVDGGNCVAEERG